MKKTRRPVPLLVALTASLVAVGPGQPARAQETFASCRLELEAAGSPGLDAYATCVASVLRELGRRFGEAVTALTAQRGAYEGEARTETDYYTLRAADCAEERAIRARLETGLNAIGLALTALEATRAQIHALDAEATAMLGTAVVGGYVQKASRIVQAMLAASEVVDGTIDREIDRARALRVDMQRTTVENRCGSAEPMSDPIPPAPSPTPDGGSRTEQANGSVRFDGPTIGGVAASACLHERVCGSCGCQASNSGEGWTVGPPRPVCDA